MWFRLSLDLPVWLRQTLDLLVWFRQGLDLPVWFRQGLYLPVWFRLFQFTKISITDLFPNNWQHNPPLTIDWL